MTTRCFGGFKLLPKAAVKPAAGAAGGGDFSRRAPEVNSAPPSTLFGSSGIYSSIAFFSALKKIRVHIVFCDSILGRETHFSSPMHIGLLRSKQQGDIKLIHIEGYLFFVSVEGQ